MVKTAHALRRKRPAPLLADTVPAGAASAEPRAAFSRTEEML
jgi:hypothetical protein